MNEEAIKNMDCKWYCKCKSNADNLIEKLKKENTELKTQRDYYKN